MMMLLQVEVEIIYRHAAVIDMIMCDLGDEISLKVEKFALKLFIR